MLGRGRPRAQQVCLAAVRRPGSQAAVPLCVAASWDFDIEAISWMLWFAWALGSPGQVWLVLLCSSQGPEGHLDD